MKSNEEGLMIIETNEKDFNKKSLKTLNHNINTYRVPLVIDLLVLKIGAKVIKG